MNLIFDPTGNYLAVTAGYTSVNILSFPSLQIIRSITLPYRPVFDLQFSCCGRYLSIYWSSGSYSGHNIYSVASGQYISRHRISEGSSCEILLGDKHFLTRSEYSHHKYDYNPFSKQDKSGSVDAGFPNDQEQCFAASADGKTLAWIVRRYVREGRDSRWETSIALWDRETRRSRHRQLPLHPEGRWAISTGGRRIILADGSSLRTLDLVGSQYQERLHPYHTGLHGKHSAIGPRQLALSVDGEICLAANEQVLLLNLPTTDHQNL